jgi:hypothetical protein
MAVGTFTYYASFLNYLANGDVDLDTDEFIGVLLASTYTPDRTGHSLLTDISAFELAGGDYARETLVSVTKTLTSVSLKWSTATADFGNPVTITAKYFAIFNNTHASKILVGYLDLNVGGPAVSSTTGPFSVAPDATLGWLTLRPPA